MGSRILHSTINHHVKAAKYAVRGPIVTKSMELARKIDAESHSHRVHNSSLKFTKIINCNIGNPQQLKQQPMTFIREVLSLMVNPSLKDRMEFPDDVLKRANKYSRNIPSVGVYTESQGLLAVRKEVSRFLQQRDGYAASSENIFLTNGASDGVRLCLQTFLRDPATGFNDGLLTPIPQYPLYSALTTLFNGHLIPYYLDEEKGWECSLESLQESLDNARANNIETRALVVINPGNPTGQVMSEDSMRKVVAFCRKENICLMADEVYQQNIWNPEANFLSFRKVAFAMCAFDGEDPLQLISFHSISKGFLGECGLRGGFFEILGVDNKVVKEIYKLASISLCSNVIGQIGTGLMVQPPVEGDSSYELYCQERDGVLSSLRRRALRMTEALNDLEGVCCQPIEGAMYAFPSITLPAAAVEAAGEGSADEVYCMDLLAATGIVVVPGSGFGQKDGTYHFRTTILPPEDKIEEVIMRLTKFHTKFLARYSSVEIK